MLSRTDVLVTCLFLKRFAIIFWHCKRILQWTFIIHSGMFCTIYSSLRITLVFKVSSRSVTLCYILCFIDIILRCYCVGCTSIAMYRIINWLLHRHTDSIRWQYLTMAIVRLICLSLLLKYNTFLNFNTTYNHYSH